MAILTKTSEIIRQLNRIKNKGWNAIVGGTIVADAFHNKKSTFSTVDFFIESKHKENILIKNRSYLTDDWLHYWVRLLNIKDTYNYTIKCLGDNNTFSELNQYIDAVWSITIASKAEHDIQIIIVNKDPRLYVEENFDFGISMAYCDGIKMHFTNEFLQDAMNKTLTLYRQHLTPIQIKYAVTEQSKKLLSKYPGWQLKI